VAVPPGGVATRTDLENAAAMSRPTARVGDQLLVPDPLGRAPDRIAVVTQVRGVDGGAPFLVRWEDGNETILYPSTAVRVLPTTSDEGS
jgi:hypothetical protein